MKTLVYINMDEELIIRYNDYHSNANQGTVHPALAPGVAGAAAAAACHNMLPLSLSLSGCVPNI